MLLRMTYGEPMAWTPQVALHCHVHFYLLVSLSNYSAVPLVGGGVQTPPCGVPSPLFLHEFVGVT